MAEINIDDAAPFPVKAFTTKAKVQVPRTFIPGWMVKIVYAQYQWHHGKSGPVAPLDHFLQSGGFEAMHVLDFLMGGNGDGKKFMWMMKTGFRETSVKGEVAIIKHGSKEYAEAVREFQSEIEEDQRRNSKLVFGPRGR